MEIMSAAHFPRSILSPAKLEKLIVLNTDPQGVEFRLPSPEDCPNNVSLPWVSFFENHIDSGMRILPAPCFLDLAKIYTVPLNQFNFIELLLHSLPDSVGLIHSTHSLKRVAFVYYLSPRPGKNVSFLSQKSIDKDYQKSYFNVRPTSKAEEWPYSRGLWHSASYLKSSPNREVSDEENSMLANLSIFYSAKDSFPIRYLTENPHDSADCGLFPSFPADKIGINLLILLLFSLIYCFIF